MGVLRFDGVDDAMKWSTLTTALSQVSDGAWTVAVLVKRAGTGTWDSLTSLLSSTGNGIEEVAMELSSGNQLVTTTGTLLTTTFTDTTSPYLFVLSKTAGSVFPRLSWKLGSGGAWTHAAMNSGTAVADQTAATMLEVGTWQTASDFCNAWIGVVAYWEGAMSDANKALLDDNWRTSDWWKNPHGTPAFLAEFNVAGASVVDLAGNASSLSVTGTTLDSGETLDSWTFDGKGTIATYGYANGSFAWNSADPVGTTYTTPSLGFPPKAVLVVINGQSSATDASDTTLSGRWCYGVATGTSDRRCMGSLDVDALGTSDCQAIYRDDAVIATVSATPAMDGLLDLSAWAADSLTFINDDAPPVNLRVLWHIWGGSQLTVATTGEISEPASAPLDVDYTVTGFTSGATDQVVLFVGSQHTAAAPQAVATDILCMFGCAMGAGAGNQWVFFSNQDEAATAMNFRTYGRGDECLANIVLGGTTATNARASLTQFGTNNFRLNWTQRATTGRRYIFLAMKGGQWKAGTYTKSTTASSVSTISGLAFQPVGGLNVHRTEFAESTAGTASAFGGHSFGSWASTSSRQAMSYANVQANTNSLVGLQISYDAIGIFTAGDTGTAAFDFDLNTITSDGFTVIRDAGTASGTNVFSGYLVCASAAGAAAFMPRQPLLISQAVNRAGSW